MVDVALVQAHTRDICSLHAVVNALDESQSAEFASNTEHNQPRSRICNFVTQDKALHQLSLGCTIARPCFCQARKQNDYVSQVDTCMFSQRCAHMHMHAEADMLLCLAALSGRLCLSKHCL